ncbi:RxLR-like protein [Plasmopara halstedii]|uniref:RxLR-like protein n=1 Tax=Plasmopara halstedii TaxID=4781 RepID=A0A0N7L8M6_PLAHL|nr:RxLR-like protein [Plasmopara halstedii]CEG50299.1 RxLR-like protein [Plasmopara halstedii]|eukprot:XP_024586668.1 RxLR-like protein [Plasmopara halstedii]
MRTFSFLDLLAATLVVNGAVVFTTAINDAQGTTFSLRTNSLNDAQYEERAIGIGSSVESSGAVSTFSKKAKRQFQIALSDSAVQKEIKKLNSRELPDMYNLLDTLRNYDLSWDGVMDLEELAVINKNLISFYNKQHFLKEHSPNVRKVDSKLAIAIANLFGKPRKTT